METPTRQPVTTWSPVIVVAIIATVIGLAAFATSRQTAKAEALFVEAVDCYEKEDWDGAIAKATEAINRDAKYGAAYFVRAGARWNRITSRNLMNADLYEEAESDYRMAKGLLADEKKKDLCSRALNLIERYKFEKGVSN